MKFSVLTAITKQVAKEMLIGDNEEIESIVKAIIFIKYANKLNIKIDTVYYKREVFGIKNNSLFEELSRDIIQ